MNRYRAVMPLWKLSYGEFNFRAPTINFSQRVSNFSALLLNRSGGDPVTYAVCDDQGGSQQITLPANGAGTISLPETGIRQVVFWIPDQQDPSIYFGIDNVKFTPIDPVFLDPVDSGFVIGGPQVVNNPSLLASGGTVVQSIAADGVTQAGVRIPANYKDESLNVSVWDDKSNQGEGTSGRLFALGGSPQSASPTITVTAVDTPKGPMAFAIYLSPTNFARDSTDWNSSTRAISLQVQSNDDPNYHLTANASAIRPPVILVHGLWGSAGDWGQQGFFLPIDGIDVDTVDYYYPLLKLSSTYPSYDPKYFDVNKDLIPTSALGFSYNAPLVDGQIRQGIADFREVNNAAAVTADVVAHSMGGDIVRTIALGSGFKNNVTYGHGPIDKLITIGTPHLGTPLATDLLQDANTCVRGQLAKNHNASFITVTTSGGPPINGAVGDLDGYGVTGGHLSQALQLLSDAGPLPFAMARVSAAVNLDNLQGIGFPSWGWTLHEHCSPAPLAVDLTPRNWPIVFGGVDSDAVVPVSSQQNGCSINLVPLPGVVHSPGMVTSLGFNGPSELDSASGIPNLVLKLLNDGPEGTDFKCTN